MARKIGISEARARLPELARRVASAPGGVTYITHRDLDEDIAMTTRSHLRFLEDSLAELRARSSRGFRLAESMTSELDDATLEAALEALRAATTQAAEAKRSTLGP